MIKINKKKPFSLFGHLLFLLFINVLIKPVYIFCIDREIQNEVGVEAYGQYFILFNFCLLFSLLADGGIATFNTQYLSKNSRRFSWLFPNIVGIKLVLSISYLLVTFICCYFSGLTFDIKLLGLILLASVSLHFFMFLRTNIVSVGYYFLDSFLSILDKTLLILILGTLLYLGCEISIYLFISTQLLVWTICNIISILIILFKTKFSTFSSPSKKASIGIIKRALPFGITVLLMTLYTRVDAYMIGLLSNPKEAGIYAGGYRILDALSMAGLLFSSILIPVYAKNSNKECQKVSYAAAEIMLNMLAPISITLFLHRETVAMWLYDEATNYWGEVLGLLSLNAISVGLIYVFSSLLTAKEKIAQMNKYFLIAIFINIVLNWVWIPSQGALGASKSTLITQFFVLICTFCILKTELQQNINYSFIIKCTTYISISLIIGYYFGLSFVTQPILTFIFGVALFYTSIINTFNKKI